MAKFSDYASWRMAIRDISEEEVELVLADPDDEFPSTTSDRHCYVRDIDQRRIQVVVEPFDHEEVVTVYDKRAGD